MASTKERSEEIQTESKRKETSRKDARGLSPFSADGGCMENLNEGGAMKDSNDEGGIAESPGRDWSQRESRWQSRKSIPRPESRLKEVEEEDLNSMATHHSSVATSHEMGQERETRGNPSRGVARLGKWAKGRETLSRSRGDIFRAAEEEYHASTQKPFSVASRGEFVEIPIHEDSDDAESDR